MESRAHVEGIGPAVCPPVSCSPRLNSKMSFWAFLFFFAGLCSPFGPFGLHVMQFSRRDSKGTRARPDASHPPLTPALPAPAQSSDSIFS